MPSRVRRRDLVPLLHEPKPQLRRQRVLGRQRAGVQRARVPDEAADGESERGALAAPDIDPDEEADAWSVCVAVSGANEPVCGPHVGTDVCHERLLPIHGTRNLHRAARSGRQRCG